MPATEHAPPPRPLPSPSPKDQPPSPRISHPEPLRSIQPTSLHVESEQPERPMVKTIEPTNKPLPEPKPVDKPETSSQAKPEESKPDEDDDEVDDDKPSGLELINMETFGQILELDEDEDSHDFSQPMVWDYFDQAEKTFEDMNEAHKKKDLHALSQLGHFLKGSSAALGLARVQDSCEKIQHYGHLRDEVADKDLSPSEALEKTSKLLKRVRKEYLEAQEWLKDFYGPEAGA